MQDLTREREENDTSAGYHSQQLGEWKWDYESYERLDLSAGVECRKRDRLTGENHFSSARRARKQGEVAKGEKKVANLPTRETWSHQEAEIRFHFDPHAYAGFFPGWRERKYNFTYFLVLYTALVRKVPTTTVTLQ